MELYLKMHPTHIAWLVDNKVYIIIILSSHLPKNGHKITDRLVSENETSITDI